MYTDLNLDHKKILITGGAGFIGSNLAFYFQNHHPKAEVVVFDTFRSDERFENGHLKSFGHFKNLIGFKGEIISGDINNDADIKKLFDYGFDAIFHQAAISDTTVTDQHLTIKTNVDAFKKLLDLSIAQKSVLVYASSGATYGNAPSPQTVGIENPSNVYGYSKLAMDHLTYKTLQKFPDAKIVGLRYFNAYGKGEYFKEKTASMILQFGLQLLGGKNPKLFVESDKILRDFIYIEDIAQANVKALSASKSGVYNVGTATPRSFQDIVDILQRELQTDLPCEYIPNPYVKQYQFHTEANIQSTQEALGFTPRFSLEAGISAYIPEIKRLFLEEVRS